MRPGSSEPFARAGAAGAHYTVTGTLARIGGTVALDLSIAPVADPLAARTVVTQARLQGDRIQGAGELPPALRRLVIEASARLKYLFFGDNTVGEGTARRAIPGPAGVLEAMQPLEGDAIAVARADLDGDGAAEVVAASASEVIAYASTGDRLAPKAAMAFPGGGIVRVDAVDADGDGRPEIVVARWRAGRAFSDLLRFEKNGFRRVAADLPFLLAGLRGAGGKAMLAGQASGPAAPFVGPVFRVECRREGETLSCREGGALPLPSDTPLYHLTAVRDGDRTLYALPDGQGRLRLLDEAGKTVARANDSLGRGFARGGAGQAGGAGGSWTGRPGRLLAVDLDGDGRDEVIALRPVDARGAFFEGLILQADAELLCYARDGETLRLAWRTQELGAPVRDLFLEGTPAGRAGRIGLAAPEGGGVAGGPSRWRLLFLR